MDRVRLAELCAATSLFTDLGTGQPAEHGLRACLVAMRLAGALGADVAVRRETWASSIGPGTGVTAAQNSPRAIAIATRPPSSQ